MFIDMTCCFVSYALAFLWWVGVLGGGIKVCVWGEDYSENGAGGPVNS